MQIDHANMTGPIRIRMRNFAWSKNHKKIHTENTHDGGKGERSRTKSINGRIMYVFAVTAKKKYMEENEKRR